MHRFVVIGVAALGCCLACSSPGRFIWADDYVPPPSRAEEAYVLAPGDLIQVRVLQQDQLATRARIRDDGKVSLPLVNDVKAAGATPPELAEDLQKRLQEFIKNPVVSVSLEESRPRQVYVAGEVTKPGAYPLQSSPGVLQALVSAGGLTQIARNDRIFVLRDGANRNPSRIRFTYEALTRLEGRSASFRLQPGDIVVVE